MSLSNLAAEVTRDHQGFTDLPINLPAITTRDTPTTRTERYCSVCRKNLDLTSFSPNRTICNRHNQQFGNNNNNRNPRVNQRSSLKSNFLPDTITSPEAALYQMNAMDFCGNNSKSGDGRLNNYNNNNNNKVGRRSLDLYIDYDALINWLDQRKDIDPRVDRVRRIPKPDDEVDGDQPNLARKKATREARRVRDFIYIGTGLLFIHKAVAVGQKLQWTCQSRCSQSDRLKGGRMKPAANNSKGVVGEGGGGEDLKRRASTSRARYPCRGTSTVSLLHKQPTQQTQILHLVIKHDYVHEPHDDRNRYWKSIDLPKFEVQVIDPALQSCPIVSRDQTSDGRNHQSVNQDPSNNNKNGNDEDIDDGKRSKKQRSDFNHNNSTSSPPSLSSPRPSTSTDNRKNYGTDEGESSNLDNNRMKTKSRRDLRIEELENLIKEDEDQNRKIKKLILESLKLKRNDHEDHIDSNGNKIYDNREDEEDEVDYEYDSDDDDSEDEEDGDKERIESFKKFLEDRRLGYFNGFEPILLKCSSDRKNCRKRKKSLTSPCSA